MARRTGIDATTKDFITFGPGEVFIDYGEAGERQLGMTAGGSTATIVRTVREIEGDGAIAAVAGLERVQHVEATLVVNLKDVTSADVALAIAGGNLAANVPVGWDRITGGDIVIGDYLTNVAILAEHSSLGNDVIGWLWNPIGVGDLGMALTDDNEWVLAISFKAHVLGAAPNTEPWAIDYPLA